MDEKKKKGPATAQPSCWFLKARWLLFVSGGEGEGEGCTWVARGGCRVCGGACGFKEEWCGERKQGSKGVHWEKRPSVCMYGAIESNKA